MIRSPRSNTRDPFDEHGIAHPSGRPAEPVVLGRGAAFNVTKWFRASTGDPFALKWSESVAEVAIHKRLAHRNIVQLKSARIAPTAHEDKDRKGENGAGEGFQNDHTPVAALFMPVYVPLSQFLPSEDWFRVSVQQGGISDLGVDLCAAVAYLHSIGVCHYDIKTDNVLFDPHTSRLLLCDFGNARALCGEATAVCSLEYRPPELHLGDTPGPEADIWALGVTLYELFARKKFCRSWSALGCLHQMFYLLGTPTPAEWPAFHSGVYPHRPRMPNYPGAWASTGPFPPTWSALLCEKLLVPCPEHRATAAQLADALGLDHAPRKIADGPFNRVSECDMLMGGVPDPLPLLAASRTVTSEPRPFFHARELLRRLDDESPNETAALVLSVMYYLGSDPSELFPDPEEVRESALALCASLDFDLAFAVAPDYLREMCGYTSSVIGLAERNCYLAECDVRLSRRTQHVKAMVALQWACESLGVDGPPLPPPLKRWPRLKKRLRARIDSLLHAKPQFSLYVPRKVPQEDFHTLPLTCGTWEYRCLTFGRNSMRNGRIATEKLFCALDGGWEKYSTFRDEENVLVVRRRL